jgi:hypothetical protein
VETFLNNVLCGDRTNGDHGVSVLVIENSVMALSSYSSVRLRTLCEDGRIGAWSEFQLDHSEKVPLDGQESVVVGVKFHPTTTNWLERINVEKL